MKTIIILLIQRIGASIPFNKIKEAPWLKQSALHPLFLFRSFFVFRLFLIISLATSLLGSNPGFAQRPHVEKEHLTFPSFKWPWNKDTENGTIKWTSGPHSWSQGGVLAGKISASRGSGLDFAKNDGASFDVLSMAAGTVIKNGCGFLGLGCIVAIKHDVGGSVMVYAHLQPNSTQTAPFNDLQEGTWYPQGKVIGRAGQSGGQASTHLHIELRDGGVCNAPVSNNDGATNGDDCHTSGNPSIGFAGSPVGWDGRQLVDNYYVNAYFDYLNNCGPGGDCETIFNYDGSAVKGSIAAPYVAFPYQDCYYDASNTMQCISRQVEAFVHPNFISSNVCDLTANPPPTDCEINTSDTVFADRGLFSGGGGVLYSTNIAINPPSSPNDPAPPSGSFTSPTNGSVILNSSVNVAVSASDNPGGSGVNEVRFSVKWGGSWYGIGTDNSAPYSIDWDMCNSSVPNGDIELGMEVWDNAGNVFIWSEHGTNPHITKDYACGGGDPIPGDGVWNLHAWMNKYMAGYTNWEGTMTWTDYPYIYWDFGTGSPFDGWAGDEFSMRFWRNVNFPGGDYDFKAYTDDGVKVYVDNQLVIDAWYDHRGETSGSKNISPGDHEVKVEFYENTGEAIVHVYWYGPGYPRPDNDPPDGRITSPGNLSAVNSLPLTIWADAWDDASGVNRVEFFAWYCDGACEWRSLGADTSAPYNVSWDWSAVDNQHVWLTIHVYDNTGKVKYDPGGWVEVDLDRTKPAIDFVTPLDHTVHPNKQIQLKVSTYDAGSGVNRVQFFAGYDDGSANYWHEVGWDTDNNDDWWEMTWDASSLPDGTTLSFFAFAYDDAWNYEGAAVWDNRLGGIYHTIYLPLTSRNPLPQAQVTGSTDPVTLNMLASEYSPVTYSFFESAGVDVQITTRTAYFRIPDGTTLGSQIGPYSNDIFIPGNGTATWVDNIYLPPEIIAEAITYRASDVVLSTTFHGQDTGGRSISVSIPLQIHIPTLRSVNVLDANNVWAVGESGTILKWNGSTWARQASPTSNTLFSVDMLDMGDGWAVGEGGVTLRWNGGSWNNIASPTTENLFSVAITAINSGWTAGANGNIFFWNGARWKVQTSPTSQDIWSVHCVTWLNCWAVGYGGTILHADGVTWSVINSPTALPLSSITMLDASNGWAVGFMGTILQWTGSSWSQVTSPEDWETLQSVSFANATAGWAVGDLGTMLRWDGSSWTQSDYPALIDLWSVAMVSPTDGWAVGKYGSIFRWDGSQWAKVR